MKTLITVSALGIASALSACSVGPNYSPPLIAAPDAFLLTGGEKAPHSADTASPGEWWRSLHDRELDSLIARALRANLDLRTALDRLQEARVEIIGVASAALPEAGATAGGGVGTGSDETKGRASQALRAGETSTGFKDINRAGGFDAGWEIDLFGKIQREIEAEADDAEALKDARDWVYVTVAADVARAYLDMRAQQRQLAVLNENIAAARSSLDLAQTRYARGLTNEMDVSLAQRQLATLEADVAPLTARIEASRNAISVLLGEYPESLVAELKKPAALPAFPAKIPVGTPADLLRRRPDILEAERRLAEATARIGVATADLFPRLALTGARGVQNGDRASTGTPITVIGSLGPAVYWPLLDFGALDARIEVADLESERLLTGYKETILAAVREVDDAFASYKAQQERLRDLDRALAAARQATQLASDRYDRGLTDFLNVLDAERTQFDLEERHVEARQTAADAFVSLYKALGGGWPEHEALPPIRPPDPAIVAAAKRLVDSAAPGR
jgi:NodT family efflux transporter outer membrane factor (OMF) lipoprotein